MLIHSLSAVFGRLQNDSLRLGEGLNIIEAPNETGKSTWCAFLTAMLYGINSRERDRTGFLAAKTRYAPWSGSAMAGRLDCLSDGQAITLTRNTRRQNAPMADFQAVHTGTGTAVEGLTGANCGEALLGVTREVFERSAFIRQAGLPITQDAGLERRVASLITSGEEDTSYTEAHDALKKQLNRRRFNKSGQLPALEAQLTDLQCQVDHVQTLQSQRTAALEQARSFEQTAAELSAQLSLCDRWEAAQRRQQLATLAEAAEEAAHRADALEAQLNNDRIPDTEAIGRLRGAIVNLETTRKSADKARAAKDEAMKALLLAEKAVTESPFAGQTPEEARQEAETPPKVSINAAPSLAVFFGITAVAVGVAAFVLSRYGLYLAGWMRMIPWGIFAVIIAAAIMISHQMRTRAVAAARSAALQKRFGTAVPAAIHALADTYCKLVETRNAAQAEANARSATAEALCSTLTTNEQAILLEVRRFAPDVFDIPAADEALRRAAQQRRLLAEVRAEAGEAAMKQTLLAQQLTALDTSDGADEPVQPPAQSREDLSVRLAHTRELLTAARSDLDRLSGQLHAVGDPAELEASAEALRAQIAQLQGEYDALRLAMDVLTSANATLQSRFSPQLSRRTAEIFRELTEGRYTAAALDRGFHLTAQPVGDPIDRDIQYLSAGAADQLYLAARLAICQLVLPSEASIPIILDDALANFDDDRCAAALRWLRREAEHRQILLFTCHSREADFFRADPAVHVQHLAGLSVCAEC